MHNEIIYTNLAAKPMRPAPAPIVKAPAATPASPSKRIHIGWRAEGRQGVAARSEALATADDKPQPRRGSGERSSGRLVRARRSASSESRPDQLPNKQQLADADEIAQRVQDTTRSTQLEHLLNRQMNRKPKLFDSERQPQPRLEHLAIAHRSDGFFHLVSRQTQQPISHYAFATLKHCHEAAAELERTFAMAQVLEMRSPETLESLGELVREHWLREQVAGILL